MKSSGASWEFSNKATLIQKNDTSSKHFSEIFSTNFYQRPSHLTWRPLWFPEYTTTRRLCNICYVRIWMFGHYYTDWLVESMTYMNTRLELGLRGLWTPCSITEYLHSLALVQENWRHEGCWLSLPLFSALKVKLVWFFVLFVLFCKTRKKILLCYRNFLCHNHFLWMAKKSVSRLYRMEIARTATSKV